MKKTIILITILSLALNVGFIYLFIIKGNTVKSEDNRIAISMSKDNSEFVLEEMRVFLESVQQINLGLLNNDSSLIIKAGKTSGGSVIEHTPKDLLGSLPIGFKTLGFKTHGIFDDITNSARDNFDKKETQKQLNDLLNTCVICHKSYKVSVLQ
jgi:hypothetical protein